MSYSFSTDELSKGLSYHAFRKLTNELLKENKTTGPVQSESLTEYTKMNVHRMDRVEKTLRLNEPLLQALKAIDTPLYWIVITEAWCGDSALNLPVLAAMAEQNKHVHLMIFLRDDHPEMMDEYLTNGGRSIPKVICLNKKTMEELFVWGPRPRIAQNLVNEWKNKPGSSKEEMISELYKWYAKDHSQEIQKEFEALLKQL